MTKRKITVAANWKMNKTLQEGTFFLGQLQSELAPEGDCAVILNAPFVHLSALAGLKTSQRIQLGAQNLHDQDAGAFTGEISAEMLVSVGVSHVIIGHSERRAYQNETDALILAKVNQALKHYLTPIFCCGEPLEIRDAGDHVSYVRQQLENSIFQLDAAAFSKIIIAYEPIWAIGTGRTASSEQAQEMHASIRDLIDQKYGAELSQEVSILYGGSCNPKNAAELFALPDVDGGLIGGASLKVEDFHALIRIGDGVSQ